MCNSIAHTLCIIATKTRTSMKTTVIILAYWLFSLALTYTIRAINQKKNRLTRAALTGLGIIKKPTVKEHLAIIFLKVWVAPIGLIVLLIDRIVKKTKTEKIMEKKNKSKKGTEVTTDVQANLPTDIYTQAAKALMKALATEDFADFENALDNNSKVVMYNHDTLKGKANAAEYWKGWRKRYIEKPDVNKLAVVMSNYTGHACLEIQETMLVMFQMKNGKIARTVSLPMRLTSPYSDDNMLNYPLDHDRIKQFLTPLTDTIDAKGEPIVLENRIPCMSCDVESQDLTWYQIRIPDWFYKNWKTGLVSICPKCGKVVEYKETGSIELEEDKNKPIEGSTYSDKSNGYSDWAEGVISKELTDKLGANNLDAYVSKLLNVLTDVKLESGCRLEMRLPDETGHGDRTHIIIVDREGNSTEEIVEHLEIKSTEMAAWQLYLLENLTTVLPVWWHGGYMVREYILKETDIDDIFPLKYHDLSELQKQHKLMPFVTINKDNTGNYTATVNCCYWNQWEGLVREGVTYKIANGRVMSKESSRDTLFHFDCGMMF